MNLRLVPLDTLDLTLGRLRQLPEAAVREKMASLRDKGQLSPVVAADRDGVLVLIDGFVRHLAARRLALRELRVEVVQCSAVQMKAQLYLRNRERGLLLVEECQLVRELCEVDGQSQVEVAALLERHKSWVCRRLGIARDLSQHLWDDASLGLLGEGSLRALASLPVRNQEELVAVARRDDLSRSSIATLLELWRKATDAEVRAYLLQHPGDAVQRAKSAGQQAVDARLGKRGNEVARALTALRQISIGIERRVGEGLGELPPEGVQALDTLYRTAQAAVRAAMARLEGVFVRQEEG